MDSLTVFGAICTSLLKIHHFVGELPFINFGFDTPITQLVIKCLALHLN